MQEATATEQKVLKTKTTKGEIKRLIERFFRGNQSLELNTHQGLMDYAFAEGLRQMNIRKVLLRADYRMILQENEKDFCIQNCTKQFQVNII